MYSKLEMNIYILKKLLAVTLTDDIANKYFFSYALIITTGKMQIIKYLANW